MCNRTDCAGVFIGELACRVCEEGKMKIPVTFKFEDRGKGRPDGCGYMLEHVPRIGDRVSLDGHGGYLVQAVKWTVYPGAEAAQMATVFLAGGLP